MVSDFGAGVISYFASSIVGPLALAAFGAECQAQSFNRYQSALHAFALSRTLHAGSVVDRAQLTSDGGLGVNPSKALRKQLKQITRPGAARKAALKRSAVWWTGASTMIGVQSTIVGMQDPPRELRFADARFRQCALGAAGAVGCLALAAMCAARAFTSDEAEDKAGLTEDDLKLMAGVEAVRVSGGRGAVVPPNPRRPMPTPVGKLQLVLPRVGFVARSPHDKSCWLSIRVPFI